MEGSQHGMGFPSSSVAKNLPANAGDARDVVRKIPWSRKWKPIPEFLPGKFHGQRSLVGYGPWGRKELDTTERLNWTESIFVDCEMNHKSMELH